MVALIEHLDGAVVRPRAIVPEPGKLADRQRALDCPVAHVPLQKISSTPWPGLPASRRPRRCPS